jgi:THO complex subunit 2 N-terminus
LNPPDNVINDEYRKWKEEMEDKAFMAKSNPLALAGALGDDEGGEAQKPQVSECNESKVSVNNPEKI